MATTLGEALGLLGAMDARLSAIVWLSLRVSGSAAICAALVGMPVGAALAIARFPGRGAVTVLLNGLMGLPSVLVGVLAYLLLSRSGPLGALGLLYTPGAMIIAQAILVTPLFAALTRQLVEDTWREHGPELRALRLSRWQTVTTLLRDCRHALLVVLLAGLGRALSEVGTVMIVGGNIDGFTRVMTTAIALETAKGDLPLSIALGVVLLGLVLSLNAIAYALREWSMRRFGR